MGLVMTPMTAAVMGAVPRARAGMASATSNASREVGGVFGIALLGAIVTHWFASDLRELAGGVPAAGGVKDEDRGAGEPRRRHGQGSLPTGVDPAALHRAVDSAFVSGMHVAFLVSAVVLLSGAVIAAVFVHRGALAEQPRVAPATRPAKPASSPASRHRRVRRRPLSGAGAEPPARVGADVRGQD